MTIGFSPAKAKSLCRSLSEIAARCSYAIYLGHTSAAWAHNNDYVTTSKNSGDDKKMIAVCPRVPDATAPRRSPNIVTLRHNGIRKLYHFTDAANVPSIRKNGLMSASNLADKAIVATLNSSEGSRKMDAAAGLQDYVRLSLCSKNPMMFVALAEKRIINPVMLEIKLEVVSRPNVIFYDSNATRSGAKRSTNPEIIRFDVVKAKSHFDVPEELRKFFQAEVLVPSPVPPHLIIAAKPVKLNRKKTPSAVNPVPALCDETPANMLAAVKTTVHTPEKKNDPTPISVRKSPKTIDLVHVRDKDEKVILFRVDDCENFINEAVIDDPPYRIGCEMPTYEANMNCDFCNEMSIYINCPDHMGKCGNEIFLPCHECDRLLCGEHMHACYCSMKFAAARELQENQSSGGTGQQWMLTR